MATIMRKINVISRSEATYRATHSSTGMPGVYHSYVLAICKNPGMSQDKLSKHMCINKSAVTRHIDYLEKNGYITRCVSEKDKRENLIFPTEKMHEIHPEVVSITKKWNELLAQNISPEELEIFHKIIDKMLERAKEIADKEDSV